MTAPHAAYEQPDKPTIPEPELLKIILNPNGPEEILAGMPDPELARLLDALYQNLDTPSPEANSRFWYEIGVEESRRRLSP